MTGSRLRGLLLGASVLLAGLVFLSWSQPWFTFELETSSLEVRGDVAASGLVPLALTVLAIVAALALAGPVFRIVFGVLEALIGGSIIAVVAVALADPVAASAKAITTATGIAGSSSIAELVTRIEGSAWPVVAIVFGALVVLTGAAVVVTAPRWPVSGRRYARTRMAQPDAAEHAPDAVSEWDALSEGDDPTAPSR